MSVNVDTSVTAEQFEALREAADEGVDLDGLYVRRGDDRDAGYTFGTPESERTDLSEPEFRAAVERAPEYVTNWHFWARVVGGDPADGAAVGDRPRHRRRFLRWVEGADDRRPPERYDDLSTGASREWGQLLVTARLGEAGRRRYEVRHVADADGAALDRYDDPHAARRLTKYDERGRYRPLKTAPTLQRGWVFEGLDEREVVETVEAFYPATVENWSLERTGELDVSHWDETAERQTGIYDIVDELDEAAVERIAESCCVDSQCLKRRRWGKDEGTPLEADPGEGVFPCREPCSLVVAAARKWTMLEREESRTYEFELTPSEKEQIEEIIDAVAEGRVDEIREGDVYEGANRYRARFLRAKRFDEEGNLSGTPTDPDASDAAEIRADANGSGDGDDAANGNGADGA